MLSFLFSKKHIFGLTGHAVSVLASFHLQVGLKFPPRASFHTGKPATTTDESSDLCAHMRERVHNHSGLVRRSGTHKPGGFYVFTF